MRRRAELPVGHYELLNVRAGGLRAPTLKLQAQAFGRGPTVQLRKPLSVMGFVYVLRCGDGHLYTGCTENLDERVTRHAAGYVTATKMRRAVVIATYISFADKYKALDFERYLKTGFGRAFLNKRLILLTRRLTFRGVKVYTSPVIE